MFEILIDDARRLHQAGTAEAALHNIMQERKAQGLISFTGDRAAIGHPRVAARRDEAADALRWWADGFAGFLDGMRDLREPMGVGTTVIVGIEADGTARCVTWSERKADCARMRGWADRAVFPLSRIPWCTHLGWDNGGLPVRLTDAERREAWGRVPAEILTFD